MECSVRSVVPLSYLIRQSITLRRTPPSCNFSIGNATTETGSACAFKSWETPDNGCTFGHNRIFERLVVFIHGVAPLSSGMNGIFKGGQPKSGVLIDEIGPIQPKHLSFYAKANFAWFLACFSDIDVVPGNWLALIHL